MDRHSGLMRDLRQHTMVALRRCAVLSVTLLTAVPLIAGFLTMAPVIAIPLIAGLFSMAPVIAVPIIAGLFITAMLVPVLLITGLLITATLRCVVRPMRFAYDLPEVKTGIVRNFSPTFTSFESRDHFSEAVARGFGQQVCLFQVAETEPRLRLLLPKCIDGHSSFMRNPHQHLILAWRGCLRRGGTTSR